MNSLGWSQEVVQHPWDPMVGIPTQLEMGCGQLSYVGICFNYVEHMEGSHPMYRGLYMHRVCTILRLTTSIWPFF
jgi:hypothetical protein